MKDVTARRAILTSMLAIILVALVAGVAWADGGKEVAVKPLSPKAGETITVQGEGLSADTEVEVLLTGQGTEVDLGEVQTDGDGHFTTEFDLPEDLEAGTYELTATGEEEATTQVTVAESAEGQAAAEAEEGAEDGNDEDAEEGAEDGHDEGAEAASEDIRQRPLGQSIGLVGLFGVLAAVGLFVAGIRNRNA